MKTKARYDKRLFLSFIFISLTGHLITGIELAGNYSCIFTRPVDSVQYLDVELKTAETITPTLPKRIATVSRALAETYSTTNAVPITASSTTQKTPTSTEKPTETATPANNGQMHLQVKMPVPDTRQTASSSLQTKTGEPLPPLRPAEEFLTSRHEKLLYSIYFHGIPVGRAELEANNEKGEVWISLKVKSDSMISAVYPVDDMIETRHINGSFIVTRIHQQEGSFRSDRGFTIFMREKNVFWIDRLASRSVREPLPNSEVVDLLSGLYYLRKQQLEIGRPSLLHVYDSDIYTRLPVEVLRREKVNITGGRKIAAIVIRPQFSTEGIFKRTGEMLIWLSDDDKRVPLKVQTTIPIGTVTANLIAAETGQENPPAGVAAQVHAVSGNASQ